MCHALRSPFSQGFVGHHPDVVNIVDTRKHTPRDVFKMQVTFYIYTTTMAKLPRRRKVSVALVLESVQTPYNNA